METRAARLSTKAWGAVAAIAAIGLLLRILAAAGGALWTDEAWSLLYAVEAGTPLRVFTSINHDNNHHLYSLWLQAIGVHAPPLLARAPAIVAGTLTIVVAALIGARKSPTVALIAAALFAVAPILVVYGSEARGYAPMLLAALSMLLVLNRWVDGETVGPPALAAAILALVGMLFHLTMVAFVALLAVWVFAVRRQERGPQGAVRDTVHATGPALMVCALTIAGVILAGKLSPEGMRVGGYSPFSLDLLASALSDLLGTTLGWTAGPWWLAAIALAAAAAWIAIRSPAWVGTWRFLLPLLILGVPVAVAALRAGNPQFARYYLSAAVGLLLLIAAWAGHAAQGRRVRAAVALTVVLLIVLSSLRGDMELIAMQRGDPDRPLRIIEAQRSGRPAIAFAEERLEGVLRASAARRGTAFATMKDCAAADYLLGARPSSARPLPRVERCGQGWRLIASANSSRLTGEGWSLYRAERLQSTGVAGSGPPPAQESRKRHERA